MRNDKKVHLGGFNPMEIGKIPPSAIELEEAILGACMTEKSVLPIVASILDADDFYTDAHLRTYNAIQVLAKKGVQVDIITVINQLRTTDELETVGGAYFITTLSNKGVLHNIEFNAKIIAEKSMLRKQITCCTQFLRECYEPDADPFELLSAQRSMLGAIEKHDDIDITPLNRMKETMEAIYKATKNDGVSGVPLGIKKLTSFLGGASEGDYVVLAARSGAFKSALMLWIEHHLSILDIASLMFQQEMTNVQTGVREIALKTGLFT